jgi:Ca2+/H+ antiporter
MADRRHRVSRSVIVWFAASVAAIVLGMVLASVGSGAGALPLLAGVLSLIAFLLFVWFRATTQNDQFVWQTPHKPRREWLAERKAMAKADQAAAPASEPSGTPPEPEA